MAKTKVSRKIPLLSLVLLILSVLFAGCAHFFYKQSEEYRTFVGGIYSVNPIHTYDQKIKKVLYRSAKPGFTDIYLTNDAIDNKSAIKVLESSNGIQDYREQRVNYFNRTYILIKYLTADGHDFLIFDEDGKVVTKTLLQDNQDLAPLYSFDAQILRTEDEGSLSINFDADPFTDEETLVRFDLTTGKVKP